MCIIFMYTPTFFIWTAKLNNYLQTSDNFILFSLIFAGKIKKI
jgi:hypothetical protein